MGKDWGGLGKDWGESGQRLHFVGKKLIFVGKKKCIIGHRPEAGARVGSEPSVLRGDGGGIKRRGRSRSWTGPGAKPDSRTAHRTQLAHIVACRALVRLDGAGG